MPEKDRPLINKDELKDIRESALKEVSAKTPAATATKVDEAPKVDAVKTDATPKVEVTVVTDEKPKTSLEDLSEEEFLRLAEKKGLKIQKDSLTDDQKKKQSEIEETEKLKFAIENNLITQDGYLEAKQILQSEGSDLTKKEFTKAYKSDNAKATKEEIETAYNDYYCVQQTVKEKQKQTKEVDGIEEEVEVEVEKPKWDDKFVKWGEQRRQTKAERIKSNAKAVLDNIDSNYSNYKTFVARANDYSKTTEKVLNTIDFSSLPIQYKFKDKEINAIVKLDEEGKKDVVNYINTQLAPLVINADKQNDVDEITKQVKGYIKEKYANQVGESLWNLGRTEGMNEGKVGANAPITRELVSDDSGVDQVVQEIEKRLPENKLFTRGIKK